MHEEKILCEHGCNIEAVVIINGQYLCHDCGIQMQQKTKDNQQLITSPFSRQQITAADRNDR